MIPPHLFFPQFMVPANIRQPAQAQQLHLAFGQHADRPPLRLEYFGYKFGHDAAPSRFLYNNIDATHLKELCLDVDYMNENNAVSLLNRCSTLGSLNLKTTLDSMQVLQSIILPLTLSKFTLEYDAVYPEHHASLMKFIENHGRDPYRLTELRLIGNPCQDDTVQYMANNYQHLRSLELDIAVCESDTVAQLIFTKLERLEYLRLRRVNLAQITAMAPLISHLKSLKCLDIFVCPHLAIPLEFTIALCKLDRLKELRLVGTHITDEEGISYFFENAKISRLESLDITSSDVSETGIVLLLSKLPNLRKLNLGSTEMTDDVLIAISDSCPFLFELVIPIGKITPVGMQSVIDGCPSLKKIKVWRMDGKEKLYPQNLQINRYRKIIFK